MPTSSTPDLASLRIDRDAATPQPPGRRRGAAIAIAACAIVAIAAALFLSRGRATEVQVASVSVSGGAGAADAGISANGYVVARTKASVSAKVPGRMEYLGVHEGSHVRRGDVIARIESGNQQASVRSARADLLQIQAQLGQARRDLERARALTRENVLSRADLENAQTRAGVLEAQVAAARARLQEARVNLENTRVRAPFDGTVLRKDAEVGEIVAPASAGGGLTRTAIVTMADLATLEVEVDVNEAYIARVRNGQAARITLDAYPDTSFAGEVRQVVPTADRQKATVQVKVAILDRDPRILPEMGAQVVFVSGNDASASATPRRVLVPAAAVRGEGDSARVWVVEEHKVHARTVQLGLPRGNAREVRNGLTGGESVVLDPPATLRDGAKVRIAKS